MTSIPSSGRGRLSGLTLEYPMSLGVFDKYEDAQKAVDFLSDREFPVENCMIVGTDLRQVERVTGRLTTGRVALAGIVTGVWMGLFVGLIFALFAPSGDAFMTVLWAMLFGGVFALVWALIGQALTRGQRDFTSVSQVIATRYEVLTEHKFAQQARDLLVELPTNPGASAWTRSPAPQPTTPPTTPPASAPETQDGSRPAPPDQGAPGGQPVGELHGQEPQAAPGDTESVDPQGR
ncbi:general stress protein [Ornithinimicrobium ciconiae]|uniref:general stress protein n=1 Tax=Ornithinimicrobium ciconiae TaxID=2594265 RepID=UPI001D19660B|nr:general stress protein [Ornithinimicrobium ciconiae]